MNDQIEIQKKFEQLLHSKYAQLQPVYKWKQTMWHMDGDLIVSLIHLSKKSKFCFFNNDNIELGKMQRWSATIYSHNLEYATAADVDWGKVDELIQNTIEAQN